MRFEYFEPSSLAETKEILARGDGQYRVLAGGTDILLQLRRRVKSCRGLINIKRLPDIAAWSTDSEKGLKIGAATVMRELETSLEVARRFPALADSLGVIGSLQLRNIATVGGNLCNASPAADTAPALMIFKTRATLAEDGGPPRSVLVEEFFAGPGSSVLETRGILLSLEVPAPEGATGSSFERLTPRGAMDIAIVSAASRITLDRRGRAADVSIALGAVAPTPVRAPRAEDLLRGREPSPELIAKAGAVAMGECRPINDIRGSAAYRRAMVAVLVRRSLQRAIERAQGGSKNQSRAGENR